MSCQSCRKELRFKMTRRSCSECSEVFCERCITHVEASKTSVCRKCTVFTSELIDREKLEQLALSELTAFFRIRDIPLPAFLANDKPSVVEQILIHQAKCVTDKMIWAQRQLRDPTVLKDQNFLSVESDPSDQRTVQMNCHEEEKGRVFDPSGVGDLSDLQSINEIDALPVRQLKVILRRNCMDYRVCLEKEELKDKVKALWKAREKEKQIESEIAQKGDLEAENEFLCKICMEKPVDCVLLECGHMLSCVRCGRQLNECPVCRQFVVRAVHAFKV